MRHIIEVTAAGVLKPEPEKVEDTKKKQQNIVMEILNDYCSSSTLHGFQYIGAQDRNSAEKVWWMIMFVLSVVACSYLISQTWVKWKENPVIVSFDKEQIPIWEIPFPAVTVCPLNKIAQTECNYTKLFRYRNNLDDEAYKLFSDLSLVCNLEQYGKEFNSTINITDEAAVASIRKYAPQITDTISDVLWQNYRVGDDKFSEQLTEEGLCFSFNSFSQQDMFTDQIDRDSQYIRHNTTNEGWNIEDGYPADVGMDTYPIRTAKDGRLSGLSFDLTSYAIDTDYVCGMPISGYKVILHNPAELPKAAQQYFLIPLNRKASLIVRPELTRTDENVRALSPHTRKCYFSNEKSLKFFKVYTQDNCRMECDANVTQHYCGCVPFHSPRDNETKICGYGKISCIRKVESTLLTLEKLSPDIVAEDRERLEATRGIFTKCDCLPSCSSLHYTAEMSQTEIHVFKSFFAAGVRAKTFTPELQEYFKAGGLAYSQVDVFFKESQFLALQRGELYGQTDFLANCGGLLGLFMGFSLFSLIEIFYFLTIRLWCLWFKYKIRRKH